MGMYDDREHNNDVNSKIMLAAIISLSFVIVLVTILHIYAKCVLRRQAQQRQAALSRLSLIITSSASFHTPEPPKTGLDPAVIATLPKLVFKQTNNIGSIECSVCLSLLEDGEMGRTLPNCKHTFHLDCIDKWFDSNTTCPVCRTEAQPRLVAEPREGVVGAPPSSNGGQMQLFAKSSSSSSTGSSSRLSSFRRIILSRERSSRRMQIQSCGHEEYGLQDLERQ